jgi:hypothetical protein
MPRIVERGRSRLAKAPARLAPARDDDRLVPRQPLEPGGDDGLGVGRPLRQLAVGAPATSKNSVAVGPGQRAVTWTPLVLRFLVKRFAEREDIGLRRVIDGRIGPGLEGGGRGDVEDSARPRSSIGGRASRQSSVRARTLRSIISSWRPRSSSAKRPVRPKPALLIRVSTSRPSAATSPNSLAAAPGSPRSAARTWDWPSSAASASSRSLRRATSTSCRRVPGTGARTRRRARPRRR